MKRLLRPSRDLIAALLLAAAGTASAALVPSEWRHRQDLAVAGPGLVRVELPDATLDAAQPDGADLRILDPEGREVASSPEAPPRATGPSAVGPASFEYRVEDGRGVIILQLPEMTDPATTLESVELRTPHPHFLRSARIEVSADRASWRPWETGVPLFRQWGAEKLSVPLPREVPRWIRIHVSGPPLAFTAATLATAFRAAPRHVPTGARVVRREEFASETVFTVALDARNTKLASLEIDTPEALFMRRVSVSVRDVRDLVPAERTIGTGTIYRVAVDGAPPRSRLEVPLAYTPAMHELLVHIHNGDSPPLAVTGLRLQREPSSLVFHATAAGRYALLSGNPQAAAPRYDVSALIAGIRPEQMATVAPGPLQDNPGYEPRSSPAAPLPAAPLTGAAFAADGWARRKDVQLAAPGVQELELDPAVLAGARGDLADLRLVRAGKQIPFIVERTSLARSLELEAVPSPDPKRPTVSIWRIDLPHPGLPLQRLALTSDTELFRRQLRLYERVVADDGRSYEHTLAAGIWNRTPDPASLRTRVLDVEQRPHGGTLLLETDNGDNPPIALATVRAEHPVIRLVFQTSETDGYEIAYGNPEAAAPRYDLSLAAARLLTAPRQAAHLGEEESAPGGLGVAAWRHLKGGVAFWAALTLVVAVLLVTVARLLPKAPPPK